MHTFDDDDSPARLREVLEMHLLRAAAGAIERLGVAARGPADFGSDFEFDACVALARLAVRHSAGDRADDAPLSSLASPDLSPEEAEYLMKQLDSDDPDPLEFGKDGSHE